MQERVLYKSRTTKAKEHPEEFMSIIIDGMNSCNIPLKMPMPKGKVFFYFSWIAISINWSYTFSKLNVTS